MPVAIRGGEPNTGLDLTMPCYGPLRPMNEPTSLQRRRQVVTSAVDAWHQWRTQQVPATGQFRQAAVNPQVRHPHFSPLPREQSRSPAQVLQVGLSWQQTVQVVLPHTVLCLLLTTQAAHRLPVDIVILTTGLAGGSSADNAGRAVVQVGLPGPQLGSHAGQHSAVTDQAGRNYHI